MRNVLLMFTLLFSFIQIHAASKEGETIRISTNETDMILKVGPNGRLYQSYLGARLQHESDFKALPCFIYSGSDDAAVSNRGWEVYPGSGAEDFFEAALLITHADGNMTTILKYVSNEVKKIDDNVTETVILLQDDVYPVDVKLHYVTYAKENIIKSWTEISHNEKAPITMSQYASSMVCFGRHKYYLTQISGDWAKEMGLVSQELKFGKKIIDTKLGSRAAMQAHPFFELGLDQPVSEQQGEVLLGTIGWTGNFRFTFEVDNVGNLRVISGINPYASNYELKPKEVFKTPEFIFTLSGEGTGKASRSFHSWARNYQIKDGKEDRMTLLNNWESTHFDFDQEKLAEVMREAHQLGVDMFLLDDGWFGNKHPRKDDHAGLGDWEATRAKLPDGVPHLVQDAEKAGVKFGIWIEPEMVNPKSELFEKHPDWAIRLPNRETYYYRNQLVLDLCNPKVQDYVFGVVDKLLTENPNLAFFKWDCNSPITNIYSPYLGKKQNQLYVDHVRGLYNVLERINEKYPHIRMMMCSGGGARCDYEALKYFTEFWPSDNTDPIDRLYIQWGASQFFPAKAMCAHVTSWNWKTSIKFRTDVAMMGKLGFDLSLKDLSEADLAFCQKAVGNYNRLKTLILDGDQYRLVSPYEGNHMSVMYVNPSKDKALLFAYDIHPHYQDRMFPVKLQGLDPNRQYKVEEINLMPNTASRFKTNGQVFSGDYLMKVGLEAFTSQRTNSRVIEITAQ